MALNPGGGITAGRDIVHRIRKTWARILES
jgi:hypothetical protein